MNVTELNRSETQTITGGSTPDPLGHIPGLLDAAWTVTGFVVGVLGGFADGLSDGLNHDDCDQQ